MVFKNLLIGLGGVGIVGVGGYGIYSATRSNNKEESVDEKEEDVDNKGNDVGGISDDTSSNSVTKTVSDEQEDKDPPESPSSLSLPQQ